MQTSYGLVPIGWVQSALKVLGDAPNQRQGAPRAWIRFDEQVAEVAGFAAGGIVGVVILVALMEVQFRRYRSLFGAGQSGPGTD